MRIGVDLRCLEGGLQYRGIGRFASRLLETLSRIDHENEYVFFVSRKNAAVPTFQFHAKFRSEITAGKNPGLRSKRFIRAIIVRQKPLPIDAYNLDIFLQLDVNNSVHAENTPIVSVLYDLIPLIFSEQYQKIPLAGYSPRDLMGFVRNKRYVKESNRLLGQFAAANKVISISEHSKRDLVRLFPAVSSHNVITIPLAADKLPKASKTTLTAYTKLKLPDTFLLYVGGVDPRKGLLSLIRDFTVIAPLHPKVALVLAGKEVTNTSIPEVAAMNDLIKKHNLHKRVIRIGFVSDELLGLLYAHAHAFVFPSRYEGFGLPVLEAMGAGCPVIAYDNSSIPEVAGDAALLVHDGDSLVPAIEKVLSSAKLRKELIAKGKKQATKFTWEETARRTLEVLESARVKRSKA